MSRWLGVFMVILSALFAACGSEPTPALPPGFDAVAEKYKAGVVRVIAGEYRGTGFIFEIKGEAAYVVTASHNIEPIRSVQDSRAKVYLENQGDFDAEILGADDDYDVAVLRICCGSRFTTLPLKQDSNYANEWVITLGYGANRDKITVATGKVRGTMLGNRAIFHDVYAEEGDSGSPVINAAGDVVGVVQATASEAAGEFEGLTVGITGHLLSGIIPGMIRKAVEEGVSNTLDQPETELARKVREHEDKLQNVVTNYYELGFLRSCREVSEYMDEVKAVLAFVQQSMASDSEMAIATPGMVELRDKGEEMVEILDRRTNRCAIIGW